MLKLNLTTQFKRDLKLCKKRGYNIHLLNTLVDTLRIPEALPPKNKDHVLKGNYTGRRECHIKGDHFIYSYSNLPENINIQPNGNMAKPYQVKQVRLFLQKYQIQL